MSKNDAAGVYLIIKINEEAHNMKKAEQEREERGLNEFGIIYLSGVINDGSAEQMCKEIIEHNIKGDVGQIQMIINSPGGACASGFSIIDIMEWSQIPVYTTGIGIVASMALIIFMTGEKGRRVLTARTSILSHRFSGVSFGNHSQLIAGRKEEDMAHDRVIQHYLTYSGVKERAELEKYLLRDVDTWLTPEEAVQHGLADVVEPLRKRN
jgi:ATP-dependent Clp protease protease subunit